MTRPAKLPGESAKWLPYGLLIQLLEPDRTVVPRGGEPVNDSVIVALDLTDDLAGVSKVNQPFFNEPKVVADWAMTYDGAGGIATQWTHPGTFKEQARLLIGAGLLVSGAWAAMTPFPGLPDLGCHGDIELGMTRLAYARTMPDLAALGFTLSPPPRDGPTPPKFTIVVPEDTTIFATANHSAGGTTDDTITAASVLHGYGEVALGNQVRSRIHFRADMHYDLIHNLPD